MKWFGVYFYKLAMLDGDTNRGFMSCGQVASLVDEIESAESVVRMISNEAKQLLQTSPILEF